MLIASNKYAEKLSTRILIRYRYIIIQGNPKKRRDILILIYHFFHSHSIDSEQLFLFCVLQGGNGEDNGVEDDQDGGLLLCPGALLGFGTASEGEHDDADSVHIYGNFFFMK